MIQNLKIRAKASRQRYALPLPERFEVKPHPLIRKVTVKFRVEPSRLIRGLQESLGHRKQAVG